MSDDVLRRAHAVLRSAVEVDAGDRKSFVREACGDDDALYAKAINLLRALERSTGFLEAPALRVHEPSSRREGDSVGQYRIVRVIGAGGMATVYEAIQERPRRRVALKVMSRGLDRSSAVHRFVFETEVLARLRHPGIAQIYEAGMHEEGFGAATPYFAMEYIVGARPITDFAREEGLDRVARLQMLASVCDAVHHGHQNGVIHRDLKPGNVLVDSSGKPKVIDFGIARSSDPSQAWITREIDSSRLVGSLNAMSPEQCSAGAVDVDIRTDVYSLGVILYELLCGRPPHDASGVPLPEALRIIQVESPTRPSAIDPTLKGDLEAILLTAIEKDRDRRYQSAAALATDIRRYLRNEAIEARPPNVLTQCRLFARRNRSTVAALGLVAAALIVSTVLSSIFAVRSARDSRQRSEAERVALVERDAARWNGYIANIAAGLAAQQLFEFQRMRARLDDTPEEFRGWEWRFLAGMADRSERIVAAHDDMIYGFGVSVDRSRMITGAADGSVAVWDTGSLERVAGTSEPGGGVLGAALSPDGRVGYFGGDSGVLYEWAFHDGSPARPIGEHEGEIYCVSAGRDGVVVVTTTLLECVVWERSGSGWEQRTLEVDGGAASVAFSHDRGRFVVWTPQGRLTVTEAPFGEEVAEFDFGGGVMGCAFSSDNSRFAAAGREGIVREWSVESGEELLVADATRGDGTVLSLAYTPGGNALAAGLMHRMIMIFMLDESARRTLVGGHEEAVTGMVFLGDGNTMVSASRDRTIRLWDFGGPVGPGRVLTLYGHAEPVLDVAFSPDLTTIASAARDRTVRLWDPDLGTRLGALRGHTDTVVCVAYSLDGARIASASEDGTVRVWDARTGESERVLRGHEGGVWGVAFDPSGKRVASAGRDTTVRLWDIESGETIRIMRGHTARVNSVTISPDGAYIASASRDHTVRVWRASTGELVRLITDHESDAFDAKFSPDGRLLYTGSRDQTVRVWSTETWECVEVLGGHGQLITSLSASDDCSRLAAASWFGEVLLWDVQTRDLVASFRAHESSIRGIDFSPGGRWLATSSSDGTVRVFDGTTSSERARLLHDARQQREEASWWYSRLPKGAAQQTLDVLANDDSLSEETKRWVRRFVLMESLGSMESRETASR